MGVAQRNAEAEKKRRYERRWVWVKVLMGFTLAFPLFPIFVAIKCLEDNVWPWEGF